MSLLGETFDAFLISIGGIIDFLINTILGLKDLVIALFAIIGTVLQIIYFMFGALEAFVSIIVNPYLMFLFILGTGFFYAAFTGQTRQDMLIKIGIYYKYVFEGMIKIANAIYTIVTRLIVGIIDMI
jgi:hypothetical protein